MPAVKETRAAMTTVSAWEGLADQESIQVQKASRKRFIIWRCSTWRGMLSRDTS